MTDIRSRPSTDEYRSGWERIFGESARAAPDDKLRATFAEDFPNTWALRDCDLDGCGCGCSCG